MLFRSGRRLHFVNNLLGFEVTVVSAAEQLPVGDVTARAVFTPTGRFRGDIELYYGDVPMGRTHIPRTTPITYGVDPFFIGAPRMTPVSHATEHLGECPVVDHVVVEALGEPYRDPVGEARAALSQQ